MDYKEWIQQRADELAEDLYDKDFYHLTGDEQIKVWEQAKEEWIDHYAVSIDACYDAAEERHLEEEYERNKGLPVPDNNERFVPL